MEVMPALIAWMYAKDEDPVWTRLSFPCPMTTCNEWTREPRPTPQAVQAFGAVDESTLESTMNPSQWWDFLIDVPALDDVWAIPGAARKREQRGVVGAPQNKPTPKEAR